VTQTTASTFSNKQVQQPSPYNVDFPKTMTAGKNYSFKWTSKITTTGTVNSVLTDSIAYTVKLLSDKTTKVKVPAGTFDCYTLQSTTKTTENGQTVTTSTTQYIAANVGVVKLVSGALTQLLSKFVKGK
jgi:hypothetical protein